MKQNAFETLLKSEIARIDNAKTMKRHERVIEGFTEEKSPKAIINGREYRIFNSNDYLGLRHNKALLKAEHEAGKKFGTGPGAVRFISGTLSIHKELERELADFHGRDDAMIFSSAFAANLATMFCLSQGLTKTSLVDSNVLIVSDSLNHRSIIDGVRLTGLPKEQRVVFEHMNVDSLEDVLEYNKNKYSRVVVVTDGVFSMLGEHQPISKLKIVIEKYEQYFTQGIFLVMDDCHGVAAFGQTGRGVEEIENAKADILVGTLGKGFGADGGYVAANQTVIDYLRESSATYIYSNSISPGTAGAALAAVLLLKSPRGKKLLQSSQKNISYFKKLMGKNKFDFAADSNHPIQPVLIGDTIKTKLYVEELFKRGFLITNISYPVVPIGRDEIRVQISATHKNEDIDKLVGAFIEARKIVEK